MARASVDRNGGELTAGDAARLIPTPFLTKTYQLVDDSDIDDVISWNADGSAFVVWNTAEFARDLLPKYFKHNNFASFIRQLNTYGFRKVVPDRWEFSNECFRRGDKRLLCDIQRRKIAQPPPPLTAAVQPTPPPPPQTVSPSDSGEDQVTSSAISPPSILNFGDSTAELIGENKRLKKENVQLNKELSHMKSICNNIYVLMSNFNNNRSNDDDERSCELYPTETAAVKPLDLLPMTRFYEEIAAANGGGERNIRSAAAEIGGNLPGAPLCAKRGRESEGAPADHGMDLQLQLPVGEIKYEPLDQDERGLVENLK